MILVAIIVLVIIAALNAAGLYVLLRIFAYMRNPASNWRWLDWRAMARAARQQSNPHYD